MKRVGIMLKVKNEKMDEYREAHKTVWPEMKEALSRQGWHNYSLFLTENGFLFGYFETPVDFQTALKGMETEPINEKWQKAMAPFFEALSGKRADESMVVLEEVFHID